jgi:formylglycine-generating enzyme required for sulfatase activity
MSQREVQSFDDDPSLTPSLLEQAVAVCDAFEAAWRDGEAPRIEDHLRGQPESVRPVLLRELLAVELELRARFGEAPALEDYLDRFSGETELVHSIFATIWTRGGSTGSGVRTHPIPACLPACLPDDGTFGEHDKGTSESAVPLSGPTLIDESSVPGSRRPTARIRAGAAPAVESPAGPLPRALGRFTLLALAGQGTYGAVFRARDDILDREVAIKLPHPGAGQGSATIGASLAEAQSAARLRHPAIVTVHDVVQLDEGLVFVVMEYVEGSTLRDEIKAGPVAPERTALLIARVAEALHYAHGLGFVHRDLKPANILIDRMGNPHVADFGLAVHESSRPARSGELAGTAPYMAPEQIRSEAHRLDGRTDVWALGVILYEMLARRRPFSGPDRETVFEEIVYREARPPRQLDGSVPRELERICLKCLSKRMTDRYPTAADLADDLRRFLSVQVPLEDGPARRRGSAAVAKVIPKGLRAFSPADAPFFLELIPGPRDRDGLPEIVRFWKTRIEAMDRRTACALGLIFGPSGCGKSSLVHAGILPWLADSVLAVSTATTAQGTEQELLRRLEHHCPGLTVDGDSEIGLPEALRRLRGGQGLPADKKLLIVLDQFEQYLQSCRALEASPLVEALRQCDGTRVQCLVLVRDDFWTALTRFLRMLEVDLSSERNMTAVDLFDRQHARSVLAAFGRGYGALPEETETLAPEQEAFLDQAIDGLVEDERVICVRLALFAEMFKDRPWTEASLSELGGIPGVGAAFLDATIGAGARHPLLSRHGEPAARAVLKALLPDTGGPLVVRMRSHAELLAASGCSQRPAEFEELLQVLDRELRLITPVEKRESTPAVERLALAVAPALPAPPPSDAPAAYYQLTHDYLVPSIREWLERTQRETRRGRALLRLGFLTGLWSSRPEPRNLPSFPEWLTIRWHTRPRDWSPAARTMMNAATRRLGLRLVAALAVFALLELGVRVLLEHQRRAALFNELLIAHAGEIPARVRELQPHLDQFRARLEPLASNPGNPQVQLRASLVLLPRDASQAGLLIRHLQAPEADPEEVGVIRDELARHQRFAAAEACWRIVRDPAADRVGRLHAACALAALDPKNPAWDGVARPVAGALVKENQPLAWAALLRPVGAALTAPLEAIYPDEATSLPERLAAGEVLADFSKSDSDGNAILLARLLLEANLEQFRSVFPPLRRLFELPEYRDVVRRQLEDELTRHPEARQDDVRLADPRPPEPAIVARLEDRFVGGLCKDRFALCQALPSEEFSTIAKALASRGYRPCSVRPYTALDRLLVAAVWTRDGLGGHCELDLTAAQVRATDEAFRREWETRGQGYLPVDIAVWRPPYASGDGEERYAALWVAAERRPAGGLAPLEFIDARMDVAIPEQPKHSARDGVLFAAGFVPRTSVKVVGSDGISRISSVRWKLANPPRPADTWDAGTWAEVEAQVNCPVDQALMPVDARFSWLGPATAWGYAATWWSGVGFESQALCGPSPAKALSLSRHRAACEAMAAIGYRPISIAAVAHSDTPEPKAGIGIAPQLRQAVPQITSASVWRRPLVAESDKDRTARRQANAAIALFLLGSPDPLRRHLAHSDDPRLRTEVIERLAAFEVAPRLLVELLKSAPPPLPSVRRALLLALAGLPAEKVPPDLWDQLRDDLVALYRDDPDRGIHSAVELVLRQWGLGELLGRELDQLQLEGRHRAPSLAVKPAVQWFVTQRGDTMVVLPGPIEFTMGSPGDEPLRDHDQEPLQRRRIDRTIAVATREVTRAQFLHFFPEHPHKTAFGLAPECPVNSVTWYDAIRYCNRLSLDEGLTPCYPEKIEPGMVLEPDLLKRPGYRLPTEAEWEAFSRAGARTTWYFGHASPLVSRYAWTVFSPGLQSRPVGQLLPNDFGLFDVVGNVFEWCHDRFEPDRPGLCDCDQPPPSGRDTVEDGQDRVMRGGSFLHVPLQSRSAYRDKNRVNKPQVYLGFRVVRTLK